MTAEFAPIFKLGRAERIQLVEDLWDSIAQEDGPMPLPHWKEVELQSRKATLQETPSSTRTWAQIKQRARAGSPDWEKVSSDELKPVWRLSNAILSSIQWRSRSIGGHLLGASPLKSSTR
jgi:putative addiction module component (TIGR02574 family)